ncbi:MAG: hypothetical protein DRP56_09135 [Planctomycetota bacterium]|nr:MAG: hypothetical protein DRP56_09135 [Planctomycetota bacterium]
MANAKKKHAGGRPTKYNDTMPGKVRESIKRAVSKGDVPLLCTVALDLEVGKQTLLDWQAKYPEFSCALNEVREKAEQMLVNKGLKGKYNSSVCNRVLAANHGYKEKTDMTSDGKPMPAFIIKK